LDGSLGRLPKSFYSRVWYLLERTPGGITLDGFHLTQHPTLSDLTVEEMDFALIVEDMLSAIGDPIHRQIIVEVCLSFCSQLKFVLGHPLGVVRRITMVMFTLPFSLVEPLT